MNFKGKWLPDSQVYRSACTYLSENLDSFKRNTDYIYFVGNDARGPWYVNAFDAVVQSEYVEQNDRIGNPMLHNGKSAGTLRYMKVTEDLKRWKYESVIEIGGGYGGQCLVMKAMRPTVYTIIDIPEALQLARAYLKANNVACGYVSSEEVMPMRADLVISDYCLSELSSEGVDFYLDNIKSNYIYVTCNATGKHRRELIGQIERYYDVLEEIEHPRTSKNNNIIIYGVAHNHLRQL